MADKGTIIVNAPPLCRCPNPTCLRARTRRRRSAMPSHCAGGSRHGAAASAVAAGSVPRSASSLRPRFARRRRVRVSEEEVEEAEEVEHEEVVEADVTPLAPNAHGRSTTPSPAAVQRVAPAARLAAAARTLDR